jgi:hypothetical protein
MTRRGLGIAAVAAVVAVAAAVVWEPLAGARAPLKPVIGVPTTSPGQAVAGKRFTVTFPVKRSDNGSALKAGKMICDPSVAGKVIRHSERFANGKARLSFVIPQSAAGKSLRVKVTIKAGSGSATRIARFHVAGPAAVNHPPGWQNPVTVHTTTNFSYDDYGRLDGAITEIEISPAVDPDGDTLTYSWTATTGSIVGNGLTATWTRDLSGGWAAGGDVVVTADDGHGGTGTYTISFED